MVEPPDEPSLIDRARSIAHHSYASPRTNRPDDSFPAEPLNGKNGAAVQTSVATPESDLPPVSNQSHVGDYSSISTRNDAAKQFTETLPPPAPPPPENDRGDESASVEPDGSPPEKSNIMIRFYRICKAILFSSWINVLLVFVPAGIAVQIAHLNPIIIFAMNAVAIVPLAGLLSHATESVASEMGDTVGSLMNVTFGNAVELIIFMMFDYMLTFPFAKTISIALTKNEIRIVQASLLGSILANLLLILGMCFLFGGLRFREQIYNSVVTQMSACLLSLSVMSLLLPTAFHASFTDNKTADRAVLQVSRGTSVILLLVYVLYLLFQLKSHAYMYQSTPQHVIDEESHPGVLHDMLNSSSSSDDSSSSSSSDTDGSIGSITTAKRIRRVLRRRRRRKSSASSKDGLSGPSTLRTMSTNMIHSGENITEGAMEARQEKFALGALPSGDEADTDGENERPRDRNRGRVKYRDFENEQAVLDEKSPHSRRKRKSKKERKTRKGSGLSSSKGDNTTEKVPLDRKATIKKPTEARVGFLQEAESGKLRPSNSPRRSFNLRGLTVKDVVSTMPAMPPMSKVLSQTVFSSANPTGLPSGPLPSTGVTPRALHRSHSLPSRLNQTPATGRGSNPPRQPSPYVQPVDADTSLDAKDGPENEGKLSRTAAVFLLIGSTSLVAVCAEFLVASIDYLVNNTSISEAFIGLIILPIVGNAAEHVTAVTVATKNKMDLAIGVAVGSSIQIALFVTPVIVLLGWILAKDMSLYFSLFETISLFVSAFIVNFLVLDGRSNYLEGALLIAAYVIIAVAAFFYPDSDEQSRVGGGDSDAKMMLTKRAVLSVMDYASSLLV